MPDRPVTTSKKTKKPRRKRRVAGWGFLMIGAVSLTIGTVLSITVAMVGPMVLPQSIETRYESIGTKKRTSWLTTFYNDCYPSYYLSPLAQIRRTREYAYARAMPSLAISYADFDGDCAIMDSGFPYRSFSAWSLELQPPVQPPTQSGILVAGKDRDGNALWIPLNPIWPGVLANAAVWSLAIALPLFACSEFRAILRRRAGVCRKCGYDLSGLLGVGAGAVCPECGTEAVATR